jgi:secreted trypsin-like serine protease
LAKYHFGVKKFLSLLIASLLCLNSLAHPSAAMENGQDAPVGGRAVPIIQAGLGMFCTGFLYTERIVLTAGHCLFNEITKQPFQQVSVGAPGETYTSTSKRIRAIETFSSPKWGVADDNNFNPTGEFGIYVLAEPFPVSGKSIIASKEQIQSFLNKGTKISNIGYGRQSVNDDYRGLPSRSPKFGEFPLVPMEIVNQELEGVWRFLGKRKNYNMQIHVLQVPNGPSTCSGDSGGPFFVMDGPDYIYLGPLSNGIGGIPNCSGKPWASPNMYMGSVAAYDYLDLITHAEKYVADNPYKTPVKKVTITCSKNKVVKKFSGANPTCPTGYKKIK